MSGLKSLMTDFFEGCLQYIYGENIGTISSFNLKDVNSYHLSNQVLQENI